MQLQTGDRASYSFTPPAEVQHADRTPYIAVGKVTGDAQIHPVTAQFL